VSCVPGFLCKVAKRLFRSGGDGLRGSIDAESYWRTMSWIKIAGGC